MAWWDNLSQIITTGLANPATAESATNILNTISGQSKTNAQINNLLMQVEANPVSAPQVAALIVSMPNVPANVAALVNQLPIVAADRVQLALLIAQIQAALPHSTLFGN